MDPTAPDQPGNTSSKDNPNPTEGAQDTSFIQPGQYAVAQDPIAGVSSQSQVAAGMGAQPADAAAQVPPQGDVSQDLTSQVPLDSTGGVNLASSAPPPPTDPSPPPTSNQPDPTPFVTPAGPVPGSTDSESGSKFGKLKIIFVAIALLILIGVVAAALWFFVLAKRTGEKASTETNETTKIEEPSPPSTSSEAGFGEIPQSTSEATPAASPLVP